MSAQWANRRSASEKESPSRLRGNGWAFNCRIPAIAKSKIGSKGSGYASLEDRMEGIENMSEKARVHFLGRKVQAVIPKMSLEGLNLELEQRRKE